MAKKIEGQLKKSGSDKAPPEQQQQDRWHVVQPGENLTIIAKAYYGPEHASHWITLYNFNRELIGENPDLIQPGMELLIPDITEFL
jgi:nucleoid-associated protein YgaU